MHSTQPITQPPFGSFQISDVILQNIAEGRMSFLNDEKKALQKNPELRRRFDSILQEVKNRSSSGT